MDRISTVSEAVSSRAEAFGPGLNLHNHVRPETADAAVMAKANKGQLQPQKTRPLSAYDARPSVEEELELTVNSTSDDAASKVPRRTILKTNNFFPKMMKKKVNSLTASPIAKMTTTASNRNGSPRGPTSPVQSLLTLPYDPPSNSTLDHGISELASLHNGRAG